MSGELMRLVLRVLGLELIDLDWTTDSDDDAESLRPPFGFSGSSAQVELSDDRMLDTSDRRR